MNRSAGHLLPLSLGVLLLCGQSYSAEAQRVLGDGIKDLATDILAKVTQQQKRRVAVLPFREMNGTKTVLDSYLSEALLTELFAAGKFEVVERSMLDKVLSEIKLGQTGIIDPETARHVGKVAGVDAIITGTVTALRSSIAINCRLIDAQTGLVFSAAQTRIVKDDDVTAMLGQSTTGHAETPQGGGDEARATGDSRAGSRPVPKKQSQAAAFEAGDYRLVVESMRKAGSEATVVLRLESSSNQTIQFHAVDWYLIDEDGNRWQWASRAGRFSETDPEQNVFVNGVNLVAGTKARGVLTFHANGSSQGTRFTLIGRESYRGGREIIVRGIVVS